MPTGGQASIFNDHDRAKFRVRGRLKLPLKTTVILVTLLMIVVSLCGTIFIASARSMLQTNKTSQMTQFAYGVAATLGDRGEPDRQEIETQLSNLSSAPNLEFAVFTDIQMNNETGYRGKDNSWTVFRSRLMDHPSSAEHVGHVQNVLHDGHESYAVTVPVFQLAADGKMTKLMGYLHVGSSNEGMAAQLRYLQAFVLLACMGVVLIGVPIAGLTARHITVPIQKLATCAHGLAAGDYSHRADIRRSDELGELADAFNLMADTVQEQQEDIRRINAGLEQKVLDRTAELEKVNARLVNEMAEKEDFLRAVSHDLNAPLRNIAGMTSMLMIKYQSTLEKDAMQRLERIQKNVDVECELINEILELSRIKSRREKIEHVDLKNLVEAVADGFSADLESRKINLRIVGDFPIIQAEKARMRQIFQNLIDNGIKYMRDDGPREIVISVKWAADEIEFSVRDTGMGIAAEDQPNLFHVFRRAKNATIMKIPGKGVGLASIKSIVENYSGRLWVDTVPGQGTTFYFALPRTHFVDKKEEIAA